MIETLLTMVLTFTTVPGEYQPHEVFRMSPGACLVGPLQFYGMAGEVQFKLEAGEDYPKACSKACPVS